MRSVRWLNVGSWALPAAMAFSLVACGPPPAAEHSPSSEAANVAPESAVETQPKDAGDSADDGALNPNGLVIRGARVFDVTACRFSEPQDVVVQGKVIARVGPNQPIPRGARVIGGASLLVLPGFIDTHTHLWQHVAKGVASQSSLQDWAREVYSVASYLNGSDIQIATRAAASEALLSGITSVIDFDISYHSGQLPGIARGLQESGVGGVFTAWKPTLFLSSADADAHLQELVHMGGDLELRVGFGPLSFFPVATVNDGVILARQNQLRVTEHTAENLQEQRDLMSRVTDYLRDYGTSLSAADQKLLQSIASGSNVPKDARLADARRYVELSPDLDDEARKAFEKLGTNEWRTSVPLLESLGAFGKPAAVAESAGPFVAIHSVWVNTDDIEAFKKHNVVVSHNPESNVYLASGVAPIRAYLNAGVPVSLGTDGGASNDRISMFDAMRGVATLQKVRELDPQRPTACEVLQMATLNGAKALARDDLGVIAVGKQADIVLIDRSRLGLVSAIEAEQLLNGLVYSATPRDIAYVIADGRVLVEKNALVGVDEAALGQLLAKSIVEARSRRDQGALFDDAWLKSEGRLPVATWFSVRAKDTVDLKLGAQSQQRTLHLAFSGTLFGGNAPFTMRDESLKRFPIKPAETFWSRDLDVPPNSTVIVQRPKGKTEWLIQIGPQRIVRKGPGSEQVLLRWK